MENSSELISEFLHNRSSGAQELAQQALDIVKAFYFSHTSTPEIFDFLCKSAGQFHQMVPLIKIRDHFQKYGVGKSSIEAFERLLYDTSYISHAAFLFDTPKSVLTFSNSSSVKAVLLHYKNSLKKVICCRSLPLGEGEFLHDSLIEQDVKSSIIEDAEAANYLGSVDFVVIGADAVTEDFVVNKVGTLSLVLTARHFGVPLYVIVSPLKMIQSKNYLAEKLEQYFEKIDSSLITEIVN